jgi:tRNA-dihydrouridine synthase
VILTGGLHTEAEVRAAWEHTGAAAVMLARGALGNPWLFEQLLGERDDEPGPGEVRAELDWLMDRAVEHLGSERGARWLRKAYPWYVVRLSGGRPDRRLNEALQRTSAIEQARALLDGLDRVSTAV